MASSILETASSWTLGALDSIYFSLRLLPSLIPGRNGDKSRPLFFSQGWGDVKQSEAINEKWSEVEEAPKLSVVFSTTSWQSVPETPASSTPSSVRKIELHFTSPMKGDMPLETLDVKMLVYAPKAIVDQLTPAGSPSLVVGGDAKQLICAIAAKCTASVIMLSATGEVDASLREPLAAKLCAQHGYCCFVPGAPLYGNRMRHEMKSYHCLTVSDMMTQSIAAMVEAGALACWIGNGVDEAMNNKERECSTSARKPPHRVCLTGFSWGGAMAAGSAIVAAEWMAKVSPNTPVAVASYCGSISPAIIVDGILQNDVCWKHLGGRSAKNKLLGILNSTSHLRHLAPLSPTGAPCCPPLVKSAIVVHARHDAFITLHAGQYLQRFWKQITNNDGRFEGRWIPGGHATAFIYRTSYQYQAIVDSVERSCGDSS